MACTKDCKCTYTDENGNYCPNHGKCCQCIAHHRINNEVPGCYFTPEQEKTYNRSIAYYNECNRD